MEIQALMMNDDDNDSQMIFGALGGLKLPDIRLTGEENPRKISPRKPVPTGDRTRARCVTGAHATTCSTAVDKCYVIIPERKDTSISFMAGFWSVRYGIHWLM